MSVFRLITAVLIFLVVRVIVQQLAYKVGLPTAIAIVIIGYLIVSRGIKFF